MDIEDQSYSTNEPLGTLLKTLREQDSLTIENVAERLNLKRAIIEDIEARLDHVIADHTYPIVFLRGYLINYAKLVSLKNIEDFTEFKAISITKKDEETFKQPHQIRSTKTTKSKAPIFFIVIILAALGIYFSGVFNHYTFDELPMPSKQEEITQVDETAVQDEIDISNKKESIIQPSKIQPNKEVTETNNQDSNTNALETKESLIIEPLIIGDKLETKVEDPAKVEDAAKTNVEQEEINVDIEKKAPEKIEEPVVKTTILMNDAKQATAENVIDAPEMLTLTFTDDCWTEIFDANKKRIAYGLYKKGRTIHPKGIAPFQVQLGDPSVVSIFRDGKEVYHNFPAGKKAHITLK